MKKALLTTSEVIVIAIAVVIIVMTVCTLSDLVLSSGKASGQAQLAADVKDGIVCFDTNDVDSLRSALNVIYTTKHGQHVAVYGYNLSTTVQGDVCVVSIRYNGLTTTVKLALQQA